MGPVWDSHCPGTTSPSSPALSVLAPWHSCPASHGAVGALHSQAPFQPVPFAALRLPPLDDSPITEPLEYVVLVSYDRSTPSHHSPLFRQGNHRSPSCTAGTGPPSSDLRLPSLCCHFCQGRHARQTFQPGIGFCVA